MRTAALSMKALSSRSQKPDANAAVGFGISVDDGTRKKSSGTLDHRRGVCWVLLIRGFKGGYLLWRLRGRWCFDSYIEGETPFRFVAAPVSQSAPCLYIAVRSPL